MPYHQTPYHQTPYHRALVLAAVLAAVLSLTAMTGAAAPARAAVGTSSGPTAPTLGYDISWPQCPRGAADPRGGGHGLGLPMPPASTGFVVIGLTAGEPFTANPCLAQHVSWATSNQTPTQAYLMAGYPTTSQLTRYGQTGPWASPTTTNDQLRNVGYAQAADALAGATTAGFAPTFVWIDVEDPSQWQPWPRGGAPYPNTQQLANRAVLEGVAKGLADAGIASGFYSYRYGWASITGSWQNNAPMWQTVGATGYLGAAAACQAPSFSGGPVYLGQGGSGSYDDNVSCPPQASSSWGAAGLTVAGQYAGLAGWTLSVTNACTGATVRTFPSPSSVLGSPIAVYWDGTDGTTPVPPGVYQLTLTAGSAPTTVSTTWPYEVTQSGTALAGCGLVRLFGPDRYATSVQVGRVAAPTSTAVVLASGEPGHLVDGLVAGPLAFHLHAPLLLTSGSVLPSSVATEIAARAPGTVYVVGGSGAVSDSVLAQLSGAGVGSVQRVAGADRYATAAAVATLVGAPAHAAVVASGADANLVDALAASGPAARLGYPVLLTDPQALPGSTSTALNRLGITTTYVVGGSGAVGDVVLAALPGATRLGGADRYATAAAIATAVRTQVWAAAGPGSTPSVVVAGGSATSMVDALAAGSLGQLTLLTGYSELTPATAAWLRANPTPQVAVVGGPGSIGPSVLVALGSRGHPTG